MYLIYKVGVLSFSVWENFASRLIRGIDVDPVLLMLLTEENLFVGYLKYDLVHGHL